MESSTRSATTLLADTAEYGTRGGLPRLTPAGILGVGSYVPEHVLTNADLETIVDTSHDWIVSRTGIVERRIADPSEKTSDLGVRAGVRALADAGVKASEVDLIIVATITGDYQFPATASVIQDAIGAHKAAAFDLAAGCSGFIYALAVAAQFVQTGLYRCVLVVGAEVLSRVTNWRDRATCVLFGDGAGAAVIGPVADNEGFLGFDLGSDGSGAEMLAVKEGGWGHPLTTGSDAEIHCSIVMAGAEVFKFAVRVIEESTRRVLDQTGLKPVDIDILIAHQANIRIIDAATRRLGLPAERVYNNVQRYGNTSGASIPLALDEARQEGRIHPGDTLAMVGFGAGLSWASCLLIWSGTRGQGSSR